MAKPPAWSGRRLLLTYGAALAAIAVFTLMPLASVFTAAWIADSQGCILNEGNPHPCPILDLDAGPLLYDMLVAGWLMLFTLPAGAILLIAWMLVLAIHLWRRAQGPVGDFR